MFKIIFFKSSACLLLLWPFTASAEISGTFVCKAEQMIVINNDMSVGNKGFYDEFLLVVGKEEFTLRFNTGQEMTLDISEKTPYGIMNFEPIIGRTYSFFINEKIVDKPFYTETKSTPFDTELRTGYCKKFG